MTINDIRDPDAVRAAIAEYDKGGHTYFLEKYGFGRVREFMLRDPVSGRLYDSKAIVGAAYGYAFPDKGPPTAADFSGGEATVEPLLISLGFEVVQIDHDWSRKEVEATIQDYFDMLRLEATGDPERIELLLKSGVQVLSQFTGLADIEADYEQVY